MTATLHRPERNTYKLPRGTRLRSELRQHFAEQRRAILHYIRTGQVENKGLARKDEQQIPFPWHWPTWDQFRLGALRMSQRMTPIISSIWDRAGSRFASYVGLDPDQWEVTNPHLAEQIRAASLAFCDATNQTTSEDLDTALAKTRQELHEGIVDEGESVEQLTKRVNKVFDQASKSRARAIAQTETARAVHAAQDQAAKLSGVVYGWRWLASSDACDVCSAIAARCPTVKLGQPFAIIGDNPQYKEIKYPPAHPHCNCTVETILITDPTPQPTETLDQPTGVTSEESAELGRQQMESYEEIWAGSVAWGAKPRTTQPAFQIVKPSKPSRLPKPKPLPKIIRKPKPIEEVAHAAEPVPVLEVVVPTHVEPYRGFTSWQEGEAWGQANYSKWANTLPQGEKNAISDYATNDWYSPLNRWLRNDQQPITDMRSRTISELAGITKKLDSALARHPLPEGLTVHRVISFKGVGANVDDFTPGQIINDKGFSSCTVNPNPLYRGTVFKIHMPKGAHAAYLNTLGEEIVPGKTERELLVGRNVNQYRVIRISKGIAGQADYVEVEGILNA